MSSKNNNNVARKINNKELSVAHLATVTEEYYGPLPLPEHLEKYDKILPGAAERIVLMAEKQQEHRMAAENSVLKTVNKARILGLIFAFILFLICLLLSGYALYLDKMTFAVGALLVGIAGGAVSFITGKPKQNVNQNNNKDGK